MTSLITIVRPNQTPDIRPAKGTKLRTTRPVTPDAPDDGRVTWGSSGNSVFQLRANIKQELPPVIMEQARVYDVIRVENPDDSDQYVETEVMTEYQARNSIDKSRYVLRFGATQPSANVSIVSRGNVRKQTT